MLAQKLFVFVLVCFAMTSCNKEDLFLEDNTTIDYAAEKGSDLKIPSSTVVINEAPNGTLIPISGTSSKLHRNANGITVNFKTHKLIPNNAYTMWFVIFSDAGGPPVLVTHAAGHVVGKSGKGNFSAHLNTGDIFDNPLTAEVHLALRSHGPAQPGIIPSQIHTIDGGCVTGFPSGPALYPDSDEEGYCANVQVAMHPAN